MSLMDHALAVGGFGTGLRPEDIKPGFTVTKFDMRGCMATEKVFKDVGDVVTRNLADDGVYVKWDKAGLRWEPISEFLRVNGELEIWR